MNTIREEIAIVGMAARLPGADNIRQFWKNLSSGVESVRLYSLDDLRGRVDDETLSDPNYVPAATVLNGAACFDAEFFGYSVREAEIIDPQHRILIECAWAALEDAGYDPERFDGRIGVFGGVAPNTYYDQNLSTRPELMARLGHYPVMLAKEREYAITRIAFKLNLSGPAISVNTACSTSGVALHLACQSVLSGESDMALVGGARIKVPTETGYMYVEDGILSPDGHCRAFDKNARGTVVGNGAAMIVVRRLSDAVAAGDHIYAIIKGTAINNDGSEKVGFTAPGVEGQADVISEAHMVAEVTGDDIQYVEAHGTGTSLGDPIEVAALTKAFRAGSNRTRYCRIGSVKTNIGHLDAGAGLAGVIKTALALEHRTIPASLNFSEPNPEIDFANSPFVVADQLTTWESDNGRPRRAGVSSFGLGGTNAHIVLEEAGVQKSDPGTRRHELLLVSAKTAAALDRATAELGEFFGDSPDLNLADAAFTLQTGRRQFEYRRAVVCSDFADAAAALSSEEPRRLISTQDSQTARRVVFMFPGGGAQHTHMAAGLYDTEPVFRDAVDTCFGIVENTFGLDVKQTLYPGPNADSEENNRKLERPSYALPTLFTIEYALARLWTSWGIRPAAMIGHSMGEYLAAHLAGVISLEDALKLVTVRGQLFEKLEEGSMLAVPLSADALTPYLTPDLAIAAVNRPDSSVVSGAVHAIEALKNKLEQEEIDSSLLHISVAAHSPMVDPILDEFREVLGEVTLEAPRLPYISNVSGTWIDPDEARTPEYWLQHLRNTVQFSDGIEQLLTAPEAYAFLEVGPGRTLSTFVSMHPARESDRVAISSMRHPKELMDDDVFILSSLGRLWGAGVEVDWQSFHAPSRRLKVSLPTYSFERTRFWIDPAAPVATSTGTYTADSQSTSEDHRLETHMPSVIPTANDRPARIEIKIKEILNDLSGMAVDSIDSHATFLELGFDSLFLTQANTAVCREFKVKLSFRQMFEEAPTVASLAEYIDEQLPPEAFAPAVPIAPEAVMPTSAVSGLTSAPVSAPLPANASFVEQLVQEQLAIMRMQLSALSGTAPAPATGVPATQPPATGLPATQPPATGLPAIQSPTGEVQPRTASAPPKSTSTPAPPKTPGQDTKKSYGPWKPIEKSTGKDLTPSQQKHLDTLIDRFTRKTAESKRLTQEHRGHLSDPRTVAGFNKAWKEIVYPVVSTKAKGSKLWDVDGNEWLDITMGYGVTLFGHSPDFITDAISEQLKKTIAIGPQTPLAGEVARLVCEITGHERAAFCNTGSEAVLAAIRTARTVTGKDRIATFSGDYHGIFDEVLVKGFSVSGERKSVPVAPGIPRKAVEDVLVLDYGEEESLRLIEEHADELAAVIVEPVQSRRPDLRPKDFVRALRKLTEKLDIPLVFDEMITGFRLHSKGAQHWYGVKADIATYGKVVGGGMPIGVVAGRAKYLDALDGGTWQFGDRSVPEAGVTWFAGTFVRHPLSLAAARAALTHLKERGDALQEEVNEKTRVFTEDMNTWFKENGYPIRINHFSSLFLIEIFGDPEFSGLFWHYLRDRGIHCHEGRPNFLTTAHSPEDMERLTEAFKESAREMQNAGFLSHADPDALEEGVIVVPITDEQQELWLACQLGHEASCGFNLSYSMYFRGDFNRKAMEVALQTLVDRHESLRMVVCNEGNSLRIVPSLKIDIPFVDLTAFEQEKRDEAVAALIHEELDTEYDLERGPVFRAHMAQLEEDFHFVLMGVHHIASDGFSAGILVRELAALYSAISSGETPALPVATQYGKYCEWQESERHTDEFAEAEKYWIELCSNPVPAPLNLPTDRPRPAIKTFNSAAYTYSIDADLCSSLKKLGASNGWTLFSTMLGAFAAWLHKLTGQDDVVVGIPASGQSMFGAHDLVGHCAHHHPFRSRLAGPDVTIADFLTTTQGSVLDAYEHRNYTEGTLLRHLDLPRDLSRLPLISTQFNMDPAPLKAVFEGVSSDIFFNGRLYNFPDATLNLVEDMGEVKLRWEYNTDLFDESTISRWLRQYEQVLRSLLANPEARLSDVSLLGEEERRQILEQSCGATMPYPSDCTLWDLFARSAEKAPDRIALVHEGTDTTYAQLKKLADQYAASLYANGVRRGSCVGVFMERTPALIATLLGALKIGAAYVPLDPKYPRERIDFILADAQASAVVTEPTLHDQLANCGAPVISNHDVASAVDGSELESGHGHAEDLAYVIYTSGSTGEPKGVAIEHRSAVALLAWARSVYDDDDLSGVLASTSICFDLSVFELFLPLSCGGTVILIENVLALTSVPDNAGVRLVNTVPSLMTEVLREGSLPKSVRTVNLAGEPLSAALVDALYDLGVDRVFDLYGPSETTTYSTYALREQGGLETIGQPIANERVYVLDEALTLVPPGVVGELYVGGAGVARGYLNRPDLTADRFVSDPFSPDGRGRMYRTGDRAMWRADGTLVYLGRLDDQVKIRGFRIELGEIETVLVDQKPVRQAVVVTRSADAGLEQIVSYVVADREITAQELREKLRERLPEYMVPQVFVQLDALPLTPNGKVNRLALPNPEASALRNQAERVPPATETERTLVAIWQEVLGTDEIGINDNFFDLGGHSLLATRIAFRVRDSFGLQLPLAKLFAAPTIHMLGDLLDSDLNGQTIPADSPLISRVDRKGREMNLPSQVLKDPQAPAGRGLEQ